MGHLRVSMGHCRGPAGLARYGLKECSPPGYVGLGTALRTGNLVETGGGNNKGPNGAHGAPWALRDTTGDSRHGHKECSHPDSVGLATPLRTVSLAEKGGVHK